MSNLAIEHFWEITVTPEELKKLPEDQQAIIAILCFAVSEVNSLARLYIFNSHDLVGEDAIDSAAFIQRLLLLRTWSSKLFEIRQCLSKIAKQKQTHDSEVLRLVGEALARFEEINDPVATPIVRDIRNGLANHYSFADAKRNLKHVKPSAVCNFYIHKMNGNSFYPLGEEVMFMGMMNRHAKRDDTLQAMELFDEWMQWNLLANGWLSKTHVEFVVQLP